MGFLGRAITLPGAADGIRAYIGEWDISVLRTEGEVWSVACSQVFFSISLTFGILTSYGSHCKRDEPALLNSVVIVCSNSLFSILTGFAVFAALGHLAYIDGVEPTDVPYSGFALVFGTWPVVLGKLPGGIHWVRLLFFDLFLLGIDSALAFVESLLTVLQDTVYFKDTSRRKLLVMLVLPNFFFSMLYCTDAGLSFLDVVDFYINFVMLLVGFLELFAGWGIGLIVTHYFLLQRMNAAAPDQWTLKSIWWECAYGNIGRLRDQIQPVIGYIPSVWVVLIKNFVPHVLIVLFVNLCASSSGAGSYGGYAIRPYQLLGLLCFIFALFLFFVGLLVPEVYGPLALPQTKILEIAVSSTEAAETKKAKKTPPESLFSPEDAC